MMYLQYLHAQHQSEQILKIIVVGEKKNGMVMDDIPDYEDIAKEVAKANEFGKAFLSGKNNAQKSNK